MSAKASNKTYGRGKYSYNPSALNANINFDDFCENKPSAAKSAGTVGKWGAISYTSIRSASTGGSKFTVGKRNNTSSPAAPAAKKQAPTPKFEPSSKKIFVPTAPKKFFKSRGEPEPLAPLPPRQNPVANQVSSRFVSEKNSSGNKLSKSKKGNNKRKKAYSSSEEEIDENEEEEEDYEEEESQMEEIVVHESEALSPVKNKQPPIVLKIFRGNSHEFKAVTIETNVHEDEEEDEEDMVEEYEEPVQEVPISLPPLLEEDEDEEEDNDDDNDDNFVPSRGKKTTSKRKNTKAAPKKKKTTKPKAPTTVALSINVPLPRSSRLRERVLRNSGNTQPDYIGDSETSSNVTEENNSQLEADLKRVQEEADKLLGETRVNFDQVANKMIIKKPKGTSQHQLDEDRENLLRVLESDGEDEQDEPATSQGSESEEKISLEEDNTTSSTATTTTTTTTTEFQVKESPKVVLSEDQSNDSPQSLKVPPLIISKSFKHVAEAEWASDSDGSDSVPPIEMTEPEIPNSQSSEISEPALEGDNDMSKEEGGSKECDDTNTNTYVTRKGSIFKSRAVTGGNKKRLALYKHKWVDDKDNPANKEKEAVPTKDVGEAVDEEVINNLVRVTRPPTTSAFDDDFDDVTGINCPKKAKKFYTVVKNVKKAHQIQESGEFQEFNDDVEYILDALQQSNPIGTRCLSAITLASKCMAPAFRMHLRAHGTVAKFFKALHDAAKDQSLGMCTATVMFVLSQDRLNMDLDRDCLELMLNLLESDTSHKNALDDCGLSDSQLHKTRARVRELCEEIQSKGHAKHLNLDNITVGHLAMETLLSLTSKRAGEWFKEELRELGGLEHIIQTIVDCCNLVDDTVNAWAPPLLEKIKKVDRCLRVLENVTFQNEENKNYLLLYKDGVLGETLCRLYKVCDYEIPLYPTSSINDKDSTGAILRECLLANLKVLINLTHDFKTAPSTSSLTGGKFNIIESSLHILLQIPQYIPEEERFDLSVLTLLLLINLVESNRPNRFLLVQTKAPSDTENVFGVNEDEMAIDALVKLFYTKKELAQSEEKKTDKLLDGEDVKKPSQDAPKKAHEEFIEETVAMLLQKAGRHMEHTFIAAYIAVLLGYLILDSKANEASIRQYLPEQNFQSMILVLDKYVKFMNLTMASSAEGIRGLKATEMIIKAMTQSDLVVSSDSSNPSAPSTSSTSSDFPLGRISPDESLQSESSSLLSDTHIISY